MAKARNPLWVSGPSGVGWLAQVLGRLGVWAGAVEGVDDVAGLRFVLGVVVRVGRDLDLLCGLGQRQVLPAVDVEQAAVAGRALEERLGRVLRVGDLLDRAPARGRALLEQALGVMVVPGTQVT